MTSLVGRAILPPMKADKDIKTLLEIMVRLRDQKSGCPWDIEQNFKSIAPYTIEEGYEVADAIERGDMAALKDELGDLLFQVVYHAQLAKEAGLFSFDDIVEAISDKMVRRHPHVFGDKTDIKDADQQTEAWEAHKARERESKGHSVLDDVPLALPALLKGQKLQKRAARVGFDWPEAKQVLDKISEEIEELKAEMDKKPPKKNDVQGEMGDLLFACVNLARHLGVDAEDALRGTNSKFIQRFQYIEEEISRQKKTLQEISLEDMEALWLEAKKIGQEAKEKA